MSCRLEYVVGRSHILKLTRQQLTNPRTIPQEVRKIFYDLAIKEKKGKEEVGEKEQLEEVTKGREHDQRRARW